MRKLLIASQKGGVGKTTTAINLAAVAARSGQRVLLIDADPLGSVAASLNLEAQPHRRGRWAAWPAAIGSADVIGPREEGPPSDADWHALLKQMTSPALAQRYDCAIVDSPPLMGIQFQQLLAACDELVLVLRAEPMAYRTLPAFLQLVKGVRHGANGIQLRGVLLTLPPGETLGGRWEMELRRGFGDRILPPAIPHDTEVGRAMLFGQPVCASSPDSLAARQYVQLAQCLDLIARPISVIEEPAIAAVERPAPVRRQEVPAPIPTLKPANRRWLWFALTVLVLASACLFAYQGGLLANLLP